MAAKSKTDWIHAEHLYVTSATLSTRDLARMLGVNLSTVGRHASKDGWEEKRKHHANALQTKSQKRTLDTQIKSVSETALELQREAEQFKSLARSALSEFVAQTPDGPRPDIREAAHRFRDVFRVFEGASRLIMLLIGLPTERSVVEDHRSGLEEVSDEELERGLKRLIEDGYASEDEAAEA